MTTSGTPYEGALQALAEAILDPDFEQDPAGMLRAWATVARGDVCPGDRYRPTEGNRLTDCIAGAPERGGA